MKLSIIVPAYNECKTISKIIERIKEVDIGNIKKEIIVVDDFSNDGTRDILREIKGIKLFFHDKNCGKGKALKTGIEKSSGNIILVQDADLEYSPKDYPQLIKPIINGKEKVVYGSRLLRKKNKQGALLFYLGGIIITKFTNLLYASHLTDEPTCYKIFSSELKPLLLNAEGNRFEWEPEVTSKILRMGFRIHEIPIFYSPRTKRAGKHINFKDGVQTLWVLFKWKFKRLVD